MLTTEQRGAGGSAVAVVPGNEVLALFPACHRLLQRAISARLSARVVRHEPTAHRPGQPGAGLERAGCRAEVRGETARVGGVRVVCRGSGSWFAAFCRGEDSKLIAGHVVAVLRPGIAAGT